MIGAGEVSAEEMPTGSAANAVDIETGEVQDLCPVHNIAWKQFDKGRRHWQAHRTSDGGWCNRSHIEKEQPTAEPIPIPPGAATSAPAGTKAAAWEVIRRACSQVGLSRDAVLDYIESEPLIANKTIQTLSVSDMAVILDWVREFEAEAEPEVDTDAALAAAESEEPEKVPEPFEPEEALPF